MSSKPLSTPQSLSSSPPHLSPSSPSTKLPLKSSSSSSSPLQETLHRLSNALNGNLSLSPSEKVSRISSRLDRRNLKPSKCEHLA